MDHASGELSCHGITLHLVSDCRAEKQTDQGSLKVTHFAIALNEQSMSKRLFSQFCLLNTRRRWRRIAIHCDVVAIVIKYAL
jgi:hypothetical protein